MMNKKELFSNDESVVEDVEVTEKTETEIVANDIASDLFNDPNMIDGMVSDMFSEKYEKVAEVATKVNSIIWKCNELVIECSTKMLEGEFEANDNDYMGYKLQFCELRWESVTSRLDFDKLKQEEDFDKMFEQFILESSSVFDFYIKTIIDGVKKSIQVKK